jgi:uncharacterized OB-fold protein
VSETRVSEQDWNPEIAPFRAAAEHGQLLLKACRSCNGVHYYPRSICPFCLSDQTEWRESKGLGTVYSFSIQRRVPQEFVIAYVTLDEGPTMMTQLVELQAPEHAFIGQRVEIVFQRCENGDALPVFRPIPPM